MTPSYERSVVTLVFLGAMAVQASVPAMAGQPQDPAAAAAELLEGARPSGSGNSTEARDPAATAVESFYRLQPSDVFDVKYRYTPEYDATVMVRPDGYITLPIVGEVRVGGLTTTEARRAIVTQASARLREPEITVELKDFQKPRIFVGGQVGNPGEFELRGRVTLLEAIAMAGGFTRSSKHSQVVLFRRYDDERMVTRLVDAKALERPEHMVESPVLLPGDFIFVPQNRLSKVERFVTFGTLGWVVNALAR
ncbi:MAG: polysaccharide biosynthesis/export family protein [Vicinamibacteraceae bacterium]